MLCNSSLFLFSMRTCVQKVLDFSNFELRNLASSPDAGVLMGLSAAGTWGSIGGEVNGATKVSHDASLPEPLPADWTC